VQEVHLRRGELVVFGKGPKIQPGQDPKLSRHYEMIKQLPQAKGSDGLDRKLIAFVTDDNSQDSCHGLLWADDGGQVFLRVMPHKGGRQLNALKWTKETAGQNGVPGGSWQPYTGDGKEVDVDWPLPVSLTYILTNSQDPTKHIRIEWHVRELLALACSPKISPIEDTMAEIVEVRNKCQWGAEGKAVQLYFGCTFYNLCKALHERPTRRLLFSGHADWDHSFGKTLGFTLSGGGLEQPPRDPNEISIELGQYASKGVLQLVVLNGCDSLALGQKLIQEGVPEVVCWGTKTYDPAARLFAVRFLQEVAGGKAVNEAFQAAATEVNEAKIFVEGYGYVKRYLFEGQWPLPRRNATAEDIVRILGPGPDGNKPHRCGVPVLLVAANGGQGSCTVDRAGKVVDYTAGMVLKTGSGPPS